MLDIQISSTNYLSPLYSRFADCDHLVDAMKQILAESPDLSGLSETLVT